MIKTGIYLKIPTFRTGDISRQIIKTGVSGASRKFKNSQSKTKQIIKTGVLGASRKLKKSQSKTKQIGGKETYVTEDNDTEHKRRVGELRYVAVWQIEL